MWPKSDWVFSPRLLIRLYSELLSSVNDFTLVTSNLAMFSLFCLLIWPYNEENSFKMYCTCFQFGYHFYNKTTLIFLNAKRKKLLGIIFFFTASQHYNQIFIILINHNLPKILVYKLLVAKIRKICRKNPVKYFNLLDLSFDQKK